MTRTSTSNGVFSVHSTVVEAGLPLVPTLMIFLTGSATRLVSVLVSTTCEFSMVRVVVTLSLPRTPSCTVSCLPASIVSSKMISVSNGTSTSYSEVSVPVVLVPTRMICLTGSAVRLVSTTGSPFGFPSTSFCVEVTVSSPSFPSWSTFCLPAARVSSKTTSVSNGTGFFTVVTSSLAPKRGPYSMMRGFASLVVCSSAT